jgi:XTP/dITP diphosphohydrolase
MSKITFITGNLGKVKEVSRYLDAEIDHVSLDLAEIQSLDLEEIVKDKTQRAFDHIHRPVLIEDVSFVFHAFGHLPGPLIKWFVHELGNEGLCRLLDGQKDRTCTATVCYGYHDGTTIHLVSGSMSGSVADHPRGSMGFGWSPIFIPEGQERTYAEMSEIERDPIAMRNKALTKLKALIRF